MGVSDGGGDSWEGKGVGGGNEGGRGENSGKKVLIWRSRRQ